MRTISTLFLCAFFAFPAFSQNSRQAGTPFMKIAEKMYSFIKYELAITPEEDKSLSPLFFAYMQEWKELSKENRGDKLLQQQKIVENKIKYRSRFTPIIGERRSSLLFEKQEVFIKHLNKLRKERRVGAN